MKTSKLTIELIKAENGFIVNLGGSTPDNILHRDRLIVIRDRWEFKRCAEKEAEKIFDALEGEVDDGSSDQV